MRILGVDPGTVTMGFGVIDAEDDQLTVVDYGAISPPPRSPIGERLCFAYKALAKVVKNRRPDVVAVEQPFVAKNVRSALTIGRAQAVAILAASMASIPVYEYTPAQIKQRVSNYGASSKEQIQEMVRLQLGMTSVPEPADASDALAVCLCHISETRLNRMLGNV
jgi:crossover junction endodeoxyribonuclease RuvC